MATGILKLSYLSGQIPGVDVTKSCVPADFYGTQQILSSRIFRIVHLVILVECGYVPWNVDRYAGDKLGQLMKFIR